MKKYRITGKWYINDVLKNVFKETDSREEAKKIYEKFCRKYFTVRLFINGIFTDPIELYA